MASTEGRATEKKANTAGSFIFTVEARKCVGARDLEERARSVLITSQGKGTTSRQLSKENQFQIGVIVQGRENRHALKRRAP